MTDVTAQRISEIQARAEKATPAPWAATSMLLMSGRPGVAVHRTGSRPHSFIVVDRDREVRMEDAEFIAHSREDIPWLLGALRSALDEDSEDLKRAEHERDYFQREYARALDDNQKLAAKIKAVPTLIAAYRDRQGTYGYAESPSVRNAMSYLIDAITAALESSEGAER